MNRRLPPNLYARQYRTLGGYQQTRYYVRFVDWKGRRRVFAVGENFAHAKQERDRLKTLNAQRYDFDAQNRPAAKLFSWVEKYLAAKSGNAETLARYRFATAKLKAELGDVELADISHGLLLEYRAKRRQAVSEATINREMQSLRSILRMAYHDGAIAKLPVVPFEQEHNERSRIASDIEYRRILKALPADDRDACEIIREMGFRPTQVLEITPADLRLKTRSIDMSRIRKKRGLLVELPLSPRAFTILARRAQGKAPAARLFTMTRHKLHTAFERACKRLGILNLWLYDLRATFATAAQRQGWPDKAIMSFMGHRTAYAFRRYSRPTMEDLRSLIAGPRLHSGNMIQQSRRRSGASD